MKNSEYLVYFLLIISITLSSSVSYSDCSIYGTCNTDGTTVITGGNYSIDVNNSLYWDGNLWDDNRWLLLDGSNSPITGNVTFQDDKKILLGDVGQIYSDGTDAKFYTSGDFIFNNGNVGIGTTEPSSLLSLGITTSDPGNLGIGTYNYLGGKYSSGGSVWGYNSKVYEGTINKVVVANTNAVVGYDYITMDYVGGIRFHTFLGSVTAGDTASSERMRIDTDGTVKISNDNQKLTMGAAGSTDYYQEFDGTDAKFYTSGDFDFTNGAVKGSGGFKSSDGSAGISVSGTSCTIKEIKNGLITNATCT